MEDEEIKIYRIRNNGVPFFPVSIHSAIIGLQNEIKKKLPITSPYTPSPNSFVPQQVWIDTNQADTQEAAIPQNNNNVVAIEEQRPQGQEMVVVEQNNEVETPIDESNIEIPIEIVFNRDEHAIE